MTRPADNSARRGMVNGLTGIGARAAAVTMRPFAGAASAAAGAGIGLERQAVDRLVENGTLDRVLERVLDSDAVDRVIERLFASGVIDRVIDGMFDYGTFDHLVDRLLTSDALWRLVDDIAQSPSVLAAVSGQGLGFADQIGREARLRTSKADRRLERVARRIARRQSELSAAAETPTPAEDGLPVPPHAG